MKPGMFIVFEGGEGAGKSTQVAALAAYLIGDGNLVAVTREPGGSALGVTLRGLLLDAGPVPARAEALLYAADRAVHADTIREQLATGRTVICDRYEDSSIAYQGYGRGLGETEVAGLSDWASGGLHADLTVLLDVDPRVGLARAAVDGDPDRIEREDIAFHDRVREGFLTLAGHRPGNRDVVTERGVTVDNDGEIAWITHYLVLDATRNRDELAISVWAHVRQLIRRRAEQAVR